MITIFTIYKLLSFVFRYK